MTVGFLRCLLFYPLAPFWKAFFEELGCDVEVSDRLRNRAFDQLQKKYSGDICLPIESSFVHAEALAPRVDWLFVPRVNRLHRDIYVCPACSGLPDLLTSVLQLPNVLSINLSPLVPFERSDYAALKALGFKKRTVKAAYAKACTAYERFVEAAKEEPRMELAIEREAFGGRPGDRGPERDGPTILMLGMPYVLADGFINKGVPTILQRRNCRIVTPFMVSPEYIGREYRFEGYYMYWTLGGMSIAALMSEAAAAKVDGVVYCSSFACGVDSCVAPIVESACRRVYDLPYLLLVLDEHDENAHIEVRVDAFLDSLPASRHSGAL